MPVYVPRNLVRRTYTWWQWWKALERKREGGRESESNRNGRRRHFLKYLLNGGALSTASITSEVTISEEDNVLIMGVRGQYRHLDVLIPQSSVTLYRFQLSLSPWLSRSMETHLILRVFHLVWIVPVENPSRSLSLFSFLSLRDGR